MIAARLAEQATRDEQPTTTRTAPTARREPRTVGPGTRAALEAVQNELAAKAPGVGDLFSFGTAKPAT